MGTQSPFPKRGGAPQFSAHVYCGQTAAWIKMPLGMEVFRQPTRHCVRWGPSSPPLNGHSQPLQFSAIVRCGQTAGCTKMPLGRRQASAQATSCSIGPSYPQKKRHTDSHPIFGFCLLWLNGWVDEGATCYRSRPLHKPHCIRRGPSCARKWHSSPLFSAHVYSGHGRASQLYC